MSVRCEWCVGNARMMAYHDEEWGVAVYDDRTLFEFLILDGFQAGLSWSTVLHKRENFRDAFDAFDARKIARYTDRKVQQLLRNPGIIRNRLKVAAAISNARALLALQEERGSFGAFIWEFVDGTPRQNAWKTSLAVPTRTEQSDRMSQVLKEHGFKFVGSTICYAFMQAAGLVNDHVVSCFRHGALGGGG